MNQRCVWDQYRESFHEKSTSRMLLRRFMAHSLDRSHLPAPYAVKECKLSPRCIIVDEAAQTTEEHTVRQIIDSLVNEDVTHRVYVSGTLPTPKKQLMLSGSEDVDADPPQGVTWTANVAHDDALTGTEQVSEISMAPTHDMTSFLRRLASMHVHKRATLLGTLNAPTIHQRETCAVVQDQFSDHGVIRCGKVHLVVTYIKNLIRNRSPSIVVPVWYSHVRRGYGGRVILLPNYKAHDSPPPRALCRDSKMKRKLLSTHWAPNICPIASRSQPSTDIRMRKSTREQQAACAAILADVSTY